MLFHLPLHLNLCWLKFHKTIGLQSLKGPLINGWNIPKYQQWYTLVTKALCVDYQIISQTLFQHLTCSEQMTGIKSQIQGVTVAEGLMMHLGWELGKIKDHYKYNTIGWILKGKRFNVNSSLTNKKPVITNNPSWFTAKRYYSIPLNNWRSQGLVFNVMKKRKKIQKIIIDEALNIKT